MVLFSGTIQVLSVIEGNCADSSEITIKVAEFIFYSVNIFHYQFDRINRLLIILTQQVFSDGFYRIREIDLIRIFVIRISLPLSVFIGSNISDKNTEII